MGGTVGKSEPQMLPAVEGTDAKGIGRVGKNELRDRLEDLIARRDILTSFTQRSGLSFKD